MNQSPVTRKQKVHQKSIQLTDQSVLSALPLLLRLSSGRRRRIFVAGAIAAACLPLPTTHTSPYTVHAKTGLGSPSSSITVGRRTTPLPHRPVHMILGGTSLLLGQLLIMWRRGLARRISQSLVRPHIADFIYSQSIRGSPLLRQISS